MLLVRHCETSIHLLLLLLWLVLEADFGATVPSCYDDHGRAHSCSSNIEDITKYAKIQASRTCGEHGPEDVCWYTMDPLGSTGKRQQHCQVCDSRSSSNKHPVEHLVDRHLSNQPTCWISGSMEPASQAPWASSNYNRRGKTLLATSGAAVVNVTLSFGKTFEVYYVSLEPCNMLPDAIAVYKSLDHGRSWEPWQYFATDCNATFGMATLHNENELEKLLGPDQQQQQRVPRESPPTPVQQKPFCMAMRGYTEALRSGRLNDVIAFSTTLGRYTTRAISALHEQEMTRWTTMTDLRLTFYRLPQQRPQKHIAFSYLQIGGKCFCNGHADKCSVGASGRLQCQCQHHTTGPDCDTCAENYLGRPWAKATPYNANECLPCECNGHSVLCTMDGVSTMSEHEKLQPRCINCQHNTRGDRCHQCADGYFRDNTVNVTDPAMCKVCVCHPIGAQSLRICDRHDGQCLCKEGVTGLRCDRCKEGYRQTKSSETPCQQVIDEEQQKIAYATRVKCGECKNRQRIRFKRFCRKDAVFQAKVTGVQAFNSHIRLTMQRHRVWRSVPTLDPLLKTPSGQFYVWVSENDTYCKCPQLEMDQTYLVIAKARFEQHDNVNMFVLNPSDTVLPWKDMWARRLDGFEKEAYDGNCNKFLQGRSARLRNAHRQRSEQPQTGNYWNYQQQPSYNQQPAVNNGYQDSGDSQQQYGYYGGG